MRILVVDDEQIMLDSITRILENETDIFVETAKTGREAIEKAHFFRPDLVMMDIKMPGISGLEALSEIRRLDPQAVLVILSAYDNFTYAQEAIRNDVFDYLLKPVNKGRILETIKKAQIHLDKIRLARKEDLEIREKYKKSLPLIESEFLHAMTHRMSEASLQEYQDLLGIEFSAGFFIAISYVFDDQPFEIEMEPEYLLRQKMADLAEEIRYLFPCFIGPVKTNPLLVFIPISTLDDDLQEHQIQENYLRKITDRLNAEKLPVKFRLGVGTVCNTALDYRRSYREALKALNAFSQNPICYFNQIESPAKFSWDNELEQKMREILESIKFGHLQKLEILFNNLSSQYTVENEPERDRLLCYLLELLLSAYRICKNTAKHNNGLSLNYQEIIAIIDPEKDLQYLFEEITTRIIDLTRLVKEGLENQTKSLILKAKDMIDNHYQNTLTLDELSRSVSVSPFYLCRLFREELGISFTSYLTKVRLEKATILLKQGLSVKECCYSVGYNDPNYFSRIFRKIYKFTPSEYRDAHLQKKGGSSYHE